MFRRLVEAIGKKFGVVIVPEWRAVLLDEERHLSRLFRYLDVDCVFDVGANIGQYGQMLRNYIGYQGQIISFEPNPSAFERLQVVASADNRWSVRRIGLGSSSSTAEFHAYERSDLGSFRSFGSSAHAPRSMNSTTIGVEVRTLESCFHLLKNEFNFRRPFLKLDTQGFDVEVVKGAGSILREFVGLQSEIAFQTIYDGAPNYLSALAFYQSFGFVISRIVPIHEIHFPELVEMDVIMIREDLIKRP